MSIRKYAKSVGVTIIGKLRRVGAEQLRFGDIHTWVDDIGNEFWKVRNPITGKTEWVIVTEDGSVT